MRMVTRFPRGFLIAIVLAVSGPLSRATSEDAVPQLAKSLSELPGDHPVLELPEGIFTIGSTWTISKPGVSIRGAGIGKTVFVPDQSFNEPMVRIDADGAKLTNLTVDGKGMRTAISLHGAGAAVDTLEVKNFTHIGISVPASDCRVTNCVVIGAGSPSVPSMGIWHDAGTTSTQSMITIDHNIIKNNGITGIYCTGGTVVIEDNTLSGNHCAVNFGGGQIDVGNAFTTNTVAVIKGNQILNGGGIKAGGIQLGGGKFTVTNNTIRGHGLAGIGLGYNAVGATISGNSISNSGHFIGNTGYKVEHGAGISIGYGASNIEIFGNRCFDDQPSKTQTWGIVLAGPPARLDPKFSPKLVENIVVKDNDLRGNLRPEGLLDHSAARHKMISGNVPAAANR